MSLARDSIRWRKLAWWRSEKTSGGPEEESDKALMFEWGIWWESRARKLGTYKNVFHGEGRISAGVRTGERHKVSEKVCMCKAGMPNPESSDGDFVATGGWIGRRPGEADKFVDEEE